MNIVSKYNIDEVVFFIKASSSSVGDFKFCSGIIESIYFKKTKQKYKIIYEIRERNSSTAHSINEDLLFKNANDISKFFTENPRSFLNKDKVNNSFIEKDEECEIGDDDEEDAERRPAQYDYIRNLAQRDEWISSLYNNNR